METRADRFTFSRLASKRALSRKPDEVGLEANWRTDWAPLVAGKLAARRLRTGVLRAHFFPPPPAAASLPASVLSFVGIVVIVERAAPSADGGLEKFSG